MNVSSLYGSTPSGLQFGFNGPRTGGAMSLTCEAQILLSTQLAYAQSTVDVATMAYSGYLYALSRVFNMTNDAVITNSILPIACPWRST